MSEKEFPHDEEEIMTCVRCFTASPLYRVHVHGWEDVAVCKRHVQTQLSVLMFYKQVCAVSLWDAKVECKECRVMEKFSEERADQAKAVGIESRTAKAVDEEAIEILSGFVEYIENVGGSNDELDSRIAFAKQWLQDQKDSL